MKTAMIYHKMASSLDSIMRVQSMQEFIQIFTLERSRSLMSHTVCISVLEIARQTSKPC